MTQSLTFKRALALSAACAFFTSACSSHGTTRVSTLGQTAAVGKAGPQGAKGATGAQGQTGAQGPAGEQGPAGDDSVLSRRAIGALTASTIDNVEGLDGAEMLAGVGVPDGGADLLSETLLTTGGIDNLSAEALSLSTQLAEGALPGGTPVDGLATTPADLVTATLGGQTPLPDANSLLDTGVSGGLAELGSAIPSDPLGGAQDALGGVTEVLPVSGGADDLLDLADTLDAPVSTVEDSVGAVSGLAGGLLGNN